MSESPLIPEWDAEGIPVDTSAEPLDAQPAHVTPGEETEALRHDSED